MMIFDLVVPIVALITIQGFFYTGSVVVLIAIINPWMLVIIAVCMVLLYLILKKGSKVMIEAQKQDAQSQVPIHNTFNTVFDGLISLRTADKVQFFR